MRALLSVLKYFFRATVVGVVYGGAIGIAYGALVGGMIGEELTFAVWGATSGLKFGAMGGVFFGLLGAVIGGPWGWTFAGLVGGITSFIFLSPGRNVSSCECMPVTVMSVIGLIIGHYQWHGAPPLPLAAWLFRQWNQTNPLCQKKALRVSLRMVGLAVSLAYIAIKTSVYY